MAWFGIYAVALAVGILAGAAATWLARAAALRLGVMDKPGGRKNHERPIAVSGGWAVFGSFAALALGGGLLGPALAQHLPAALDPLPHYLENLRGVRRELLGVFAGGAWIFLVGLVDDLRPLGPRLKLFAQFAATVPLIASGVSIHLFLPWPPLGWILTVVWAVTLMNSFNFIDNMDGLCASVAATVAATLAVGAWLGGELVLPGLFLVFAGCLVGFLFFNFNPATIFLGDAGALTIGYFMAVFSIMITFYGKGAPTGLPTLIPLAVMGTPLFDTASVMFIRWRLGKPFMVGDHNHFSHRLRAMGFSVRQTAVVIAALTGAVGLLALALRRLGPAEAAAHLAGLLLLFGVVAALEFVGRKK